MLLEDAEETNLDLDTGAGYFSMIRRAEGGIRLYFRGSQGGYSNTMTCTSEDGVNFTTPVQLFEGTHICHNFFVFYDHTGGLRGIGGQNIPITNRPHNDGIYSFTSTDGLAFEDTGRIISDQHPGFVDAIKLWGKRGDIDGHMCCLYHPGQARYILYIRSNPEQGQRFVQYAKARNFGDFGPLTHIKLKNFQLGREQVYYPNFFLVDGEFFGILPMGNTEDTWMSLVRSTDGEHWHVTDEFLQSSPWVDKTGAYKNPDHVGNGVIDWGDHIAVYVHKNYFGAGKGLKPSLVRYKIRKTNLFKI